MLKAGLYSSSRELLMNGSRQDYAQLAASVRQALASAAAVSLPILSTGDHRLTSLVVRSGMPPNRVTHEGTDVVFSIAPALEKQFLSFIQFPADSELPDSPVRYHHHYDGIADDGTFVAADSLPVVFGLEGV
jgi:hypothetical protein